MRRLHLTPLLLLLLETSAWFQTSTRPSRPRLQSLSGSTDTSTSTSTTTPLRSYLSPNSPTARLDRIVKFDSMVSEMTLSSTVIEFVEDDETKMLFRGLAAATKNPQVRNAFAIC